MADSNFSEQESLAIISSMINKARNQFTENGHLYLLWGWIILICSVGHFVLQQVIHSPSFYLIWLLIWPTVLYQFIYLRRKTRKATVRTYSDEIAGYVWLVFIICSILLVSLLTKQLKSPDYITIIWLVMYGMPTFLSGAVLRYKGLMIGAVSCWVLAVCTVFIPVPYHMLLLATAVICGWIMPGYGMRKKIKKQTKESIYEGL